MNNDLARRAVACKGWRWMPGMLAKHPDFRDVRMSHVGRKRMHGACRYASPMGGVSHAVVALSLSNSSDVLPDLSDPATLGCLLGLVRLARLDPAWLPTCLDGEALGAWVIEPPSRNRQTRHESYAAVLVAALEAAP
jgi:hypothetical protein